ncbi:MAG: glycosyltransferase family 2 protein [Paludibacteraceae bacterium]|nr:glycosyltransferase family 2 protein [Paludibacteraceae bacterium]
MINILMSTYNGEKYLTEQLDSILLQTYTDWNLFIRDDGSNDNTITILNNYKKKYSDKITIVSDGQNLGACHSFERLLQGNDNADYFAFSDQDDVWLPDKLAHCLKTMQTAEQQFVNTPIIIHTDLEVVNEQLQTINPSFWQYSNIQPSLVNNNLHYLAICNSVTGCTMMMNKKAREYGLPVSPNAYMHDAWIALQTLLHNGKVIPLFETTVKYRQHNSNVLGAVPYRSTLTNLRFKWHLAKQAYKQAHPHIFANILTFTYWKLRYFFALHL